MISVNFKFNKIVSTNNGYFIRKGFRSKSKDAVLFQESFRSEFHKAKSLFSGFNKDNHYFKMEILWYNPKFFTKTNSVNCSSGDIDGPLKFIIDGVFTGLGVNDACLKALSIEQFPSENKHHDIILRLTMHSLAGLSKMHE